MFAVMSKYRVVPSNNFAKTPGSLGSWVGFTLEKSILTLEYLRGKDPEEAWRETRMAILGVILGD